MAKILHLRDTPNYTIKVQSYNDDKNENQKLQPLRSLFTPKKQQKLIKKLFHKNEAEFDNLIDELEPVQDWPQALKKVDQKFKKYNTNLHDRNAVIFTDILYSRYFPDDKQIKIK